MVGFRVRWRTAKHRLAADWTHFRENTIQRTLVRGLREIAVRLTSLIFARRAQWVGFLALLVTLSCTATTPHVFLALAILTRVVLAWMEEEQTWETKTDVNAQRV
jgi:hypothetical protein